MMVSRTRMLARFVALFAVVFPVMSSLVAAQVERTIYGFGAIPNDGSSPNGDLIVDRKGNLYGTTAGGGQYNYGTVFKLMPKTSGGWAETILYNFAGTPDGAYPSGGVIFDAAGNLYGATNYGGANVNSFTSGGTVYELSPPKKGGSQWTETILFDFSSSNAGWAGIPVENCSSTRWAIYMERREPAAMAMPIFAATRGAARYFSSNQPV